MTLYDLITFENNTYSYNGIVESNRYLFTTKEKAIARAESLNLKIVYQSDSNKECEIEERTIEG